MAAQTEKTWVLPCMPKEDRFRWKHVPQAWADCQANIIALPAHKGGNIAGCQGQENKAEEILMTTTYPAEEVLQRIKDWPVPHWSALIRFINMETGWTAYGRIWFSNDLWNFATGGFSGNEEIINAMQDNHIFWAACWQSSVRGGLFTFKVP